MVEEEVEGVACSERGGDDSWRGGAWEEGEANKDKEVAKRKQGRQRS